LTAKSAVNPGLWDVTPSALKSLDVPDSFPGVPDITRTRIPTVSRVSRSQGRAGGSPYRLAQHFDSRELKPAGKPFVVADNAGAFSASHNGVIVLGNESTRQNLFHCLIGVLFYHVLIGQERVRHIGMVRLVTHSHRLPNRPIGCLPARVRGRSPQPAPFLFHHLHDMAFALNTRRSDVSAKLFCQRSESPEIFFCRTGLGLYFNSHTLTDNEVYFELRERTPVGKRQINI
jgi:hypothetical protein